MGCGAGQRLQPRPGEERGAQGNGDAAGFAQLRSGGEGLQSISVQTLTSFSTSLVKFEQMKNACCLLLINKAVGQWKTISSGLHLLLYALCHWPLPQPPQILVTQSSKAVSFLTIRAGWVAFPTGASRAHVPGGQCWPWLCAEAPGHRSLAG